MMADLLNLWFPMMKETMALCNIPAGEFILETPGV